MTDYRKTKLAFTDVEATGLDTQQDEIISIALVIRDTNNHTHVSQEWYMHPKYPENFPQNIRDINGYTYDGWESKGVTTHEKALKEFTEVTKDCVFVAYNLPFDKDIIQTEQKRYGLMWEMSTHLYINVKAMAWKIFLENESIKSPSLVDLCNFFGISNTGAHDAMIDVHRMIQVYDNILHQTHSIPSTKGTSNTFW